MNWKKDTFGFRSICMDLMMKVYLYSKREWLFFILICLAIGAYYCSHLTTAGLWYDESIEYFYSKYMVGITPLSERYDNMYERICSTYQPPLYNILMYLYLQLHDSEVFFRLSGVVFTFVGGIGFYCGLRKIIGYIWANIGLCVYLSMSCVVAYALECAEYNLLLAMECWMLYFFVQSLLQRNGRRWKFIMGFYLFAALSFYSQYGAVFFIAAMFISMLVQYIRDKDNRSVMWLIGLGFVTLLFAVLPLWIWFARIQMENQQSLTVDHSPVFVKNILYSIVVSLYHTFVFMFGGAKSIRIMVLFVVLCTIYAAARSKRTSLLNIFILTSGVCWLSFFAASACSYYAFNSWDGTYGCYNIINGSRYVLFIVPLFVFTLVIGLHSFYHAVITLKYVHYGMSVFIILLPFFIYLNMWRESIWIKSDIRESTLTWLKKKGYEYPTLVQEWAAGTFHFYFEHSPKFNKRTAANIITPDIRFRTGDEDVLRSYFHELGVFSHNELFYIGTKQTEMAFGTPELVENVFAKEGYRVDTVAIEPLSIVFHLKKSVDKNY